MGELFDKKDKEPADTNMVKIAVFGLGLLMILVSLADLIDLASAGNSLWSFTATCGGSGDCIATTAPGLIIIGLGLVFVSLGLVITGVILLWVGILVGFIAFWINFGFLAFLVIVGVTVLWLLSQPLIHKLKKR
ncbi:MAG: hypothetical protein WC797_01230 [Candidatus Paceibacterota bacterium]